MASSAEQIDDLLEWHPGAPAAAHINPWRALLWGARRACKSKLLIALLWLLQALLLQRVGIAALALMRSGASWSETIGSLATTTPALSPAAVGAGQIAPLLASIGRVPWSPTPYFVFFYGVLAGGAVAYLHAPRPTALLPQFGAGCGAYLARFVRLLVLVALLSWLLQRAGAAIFAAADPADSPWPRALLWHGTAVLVAALFDYARIRTVARDSRSMLLEVARSAGFFARNLPRLLMLELGIVVLGALVTILVMTASVGLRGLFPPAAASLITEQMFVVAFLWVRLAGWAAMLSIYQGIALRGLARRP